MVEQDMDTIKVKLHNGLLITVIYLMTSVLASHALTTAQLDTLADGLAIRAKVLDNMKHSAVSHVLRIQVTNSGTTPVPGSGWRLFFHSMYLVYPSVFPKQMSKTLDIEKIKVSMIQGDLYSLEPVPGFVEMDTGESRNFDIDVAVWSISRTDFMPRWYLESTDGTISPRVVKATDAMSLDYVNAFDDVRQWKRYNTDRYNPFTAQARMRRLKTSDLGKATKLIIPTPTSITVEDAAATLEVDNTWTVNNMAPDAAGVAGYLANKTGLRQGNSALSTKKIVLKMDASIDTGPESYNLQINPSDDLIQILATDSVGLFYGVQSLLSLFASYPTRIFPKISVVDKPRFEYRGMHVDVARNFHSVDDVKRLMQGMAMYKMNKLHLHLTDDEGWRLEIPGLQELTQVGGRRCADLNEDMCVIPQFGSGPFANSSGSGYYSTTDYKDLLRFAQQHYIEVIPEFDMPGHAHAAIVSMEQRFSHLSAQGETDSANEFRLEDENDTSTYISVQQWLDNAVNPCLTSTYAFIGHVMDSVIELHKDIQPLRTYHFGGDEVAGGAWEKSPRCNEFLAQNPKYNVKKGLKKYFAEQVSILTAARGLGMRGWEDGFMDADGHPYPTDDLHNQNLSANPWDNIWEWGASERAYSLANAGYKVIMSQATDLYFDHPYEPDPEERGLYWATRYTDTKKTFGFLPDSLYDNIDVRRSGEPLTKADVCGADLSRCARLVKPENVIGMQGNLWSETVRSSENMDFMVFPRLVALAERAWHKAGFESETISTNERSRLMELDWRDFANTIGYKELKRLDDLGIQYRVPPPGGRVVDGVVEVSTTFPGLGVLYSRDGGPWIANTAAEPLRWQDGKTLHIKTDAGQNRYSRVVQLFEVEAAPWADQGTIDYISEHVEVNVSAVDNLDKDDNYVKVRLWLHNAGGQTVGAGTWRLYFYSLYGSRTESLDCNMEVGHVNGGLYYFTPISGEFTGIAPGDTLACIYHNKNWLVTRTDNMPNWFVSSTGLIPKPILNTISETLDYVAPFDTAVKWKRSKEDKYNPYTAQERYTMYTMTDSGVKNDILPTPVSVTEMEGPLLNYTTSGGWVVVTSGTFTHEAEFLAEKLQLTTRTTTPSRRYIKLTNVQLEPDFDDTQAYKINIDPEAEVIEITAQANTGAFYGVQSLLSLLTEDHVTIPKLIIKDKPRFQYRGVMVDVARSFKPVEWMHRFIDTMATYKLNRLHLHLADNEGWRVDIPAIPELTQVGGKRCQDHDRYECLTPQWGSGPDNTTAGSGYYSVSEYREILQFAEDRHITVIPEIDMPGHSWAAVSAMVYREEKLNKMKTHHYTDASNMESYLLSDVLFANVTDTPAKWRGNNMNPCIDAPYRFVEAVIDGFIDLHRGVQDLETFHIGGDEVAEGSWDDSPACQARSGGNSVDTKSIQQHFVRKVGELVARKGLNMAAWEDGVYGDSGPYPRSLFNSSEVHVYAWNNIWEQGHGARAAQFADSDYKVVLALATHMYLDQAQEPDPEERGLYWSARFIDTKKVFGFMPDDIFANADVTRMGDAIDMEQLCASNGCPQTTKPHNIIGMQSCIWTETMRTEEQFHYMAFPRLLAMAERSWHRADWEGIGTVGDRDKLREAGWENFASALGHKELPRLEKNNILYRVPPPGATVDGHTLKVATVYPNHAVDFSTSGGQYWDIIHGGKKEFQPGTHSVTLRSRSSVLQRPSRSVHIAMTVPKDHVSTAAAIPAVSLSLWLVVILYCLMQ